MKEKNVRVYIYNEVKKKKGLCIKLSASVIRGMPDRMVLMPGGKIKFCELKTTGLNPRPGQYRLHKILSKMGFEIWVCDSTYSVDNFIKSFDK